MRITAIVMVLMAGATLSCFGQNQCNSRVDYSVKATSSTAYSLSLTSEQLLSNVQIQLVDLYTGKVVKETKVGTLSDKQLIFSDVKASLYTIYVKYDGCEKKRSVGGIEGIKVGNL